MTTSVNFFKETIRDVPLAGKTVLVRADYNVPLSEDGEISDDLRIRASIPTIQYLLEHNCKVVIISHLGRPEGRDKKYSLEPVAIRLTQLLEQDVHFVDQTIGDKPFQAIKRLGKGSVTILENLRFYPEEEADDLVFAKAIAKASNAEYFVQDGFGVVHRAHASIHAITLVLPSVAGLLLEREYITITNAMESPKRPLITIMGGAKVSDKISVIERFVERADQILVGGAMANTFIDYRGMNVGKSTYESEQKDTLDSIYAAVKIRQREKSVDDFIVIPRDVAVARSLSESEQRRIVAIDQIADDELALDIGDKTIELFADSIAHAGTVIWNGPVGYSTLPEFSHGSARVALALATHPRVISIVGGGDTAEFVLRWGDGSGSEFTHVSTGGGASLELMAGDKLPGIESLLDARR